MHKEKTRQKRGDGTLFETAWCDVLFELAERPLRGVVIHTIRAIPNLFPIIGRTIWPVLRFEAQAGAEGVGDAQRSRGGSRPRPADALRRHPCCGVYVYEWPIGLYRQPETTRFTVGNGG